MNVAVDADNELAPATKVFIVEDEALIAMELQDRLSMLGYLVSGKASRAEEAVEAILRAKPDLVLMDVRLAGVTTGIDAAAQLRARTDVPVIFLSAYSDAELLRQAGTVEPFGYLVKPFEERELHASIQMALYRHRMEKALRESHARLEERVAQRTAELARSREDLAVTLDSIGDAVLATDASGRITRLNPVAEELTEWTQREALGRPVWEVFRIINEQTGWPARMPVDHVLSTGERQSLANHTALVTRGGKLLSIADSAAPIRDAAGVIVGVVVVFRDETEARERRKLVARQGTMLGALSRVQQEFINSPDAIVPFEDMLAVLLYASDSDMGFLGEVQRNAQGKAQLALRAARGGCWGELAQSVNSSDPPDPGHTGRLVERLRAALESSQPMIAGEGPVDRNPEAAAHPSSPPQSLLAIPIAVAGTVVGLVGVGNGSRRYDERLVAEIQPLLATFGSLIQGRRGALRRRAAEESLRELNTDLEAEVERRTAERRQTEEALRIVSTELVALEGGELYSLMVRRLAEVLDVDIAMVARLKSDESGLLETLAIVEDGRIAGNFSFRIAGTGWADIAIAQPFIIPTEARRRCGRDPYVVKRDVAAIAAVPLLDRAGLPVGELIAMSRRPFGNPARVEAILPIFAIVASAEIEQQRSARRFHDLFEFSPEAIVMTDPLGVIRLINRKGEEMFGWSREELDGRNIDELLPAQRVVWENLRQRLTGGDEPHPVHMELPSAQATRKNRTDFPVEISLGSIDTGDGVMIAAAIRDIGDRLNAQRQANRAQRLESIGTLAGGIAHDLNNTLTPILLALDTLKEQFPTETEILATVESSANHAADMVRHLLAFARGTEGQRTSIDPRRLLDDMEKIIKGTFPKNILVRLRIAKDLPTVLGDATQLHQVLLNLCVNARDALPSGGTLTLEADAADTEPGVADLWEDPGTRPARYVVLRVIDTGTGITPDVQERIFDPFFTTKGPESGTGLGLFTVAGIVKGHSGFIRLKSQPSAGSTFAVYLPAEANLAEQVPVIPAPTGFSGSGETVLYVDDESAVRDVVRAVLTRLNFNPVIASDALEGLVQAVENRAALRAVITDLHMPKMDGLAFVATVRRMLPNVAVIVASGRLEGPVEQELRRLGVRAILNKPFTEEMLRVALKDALPGV